MTKGDYKATAQAVKGMPLTNLARISVADHLADTYAKRDKNFKREPFLELCGVL
jgi:hypothetical protein